MGSRQEMNSQIIHDSLHARKGWTEPYLLEAGGVGCGVWLDCGRRTLEGEADGVRVLRGTRHIAHTCSELIRSGCSQKPARATRIETQSNDPLLTVMLAHVR